MTAGLIRLTSMVPEKVKSARLYQEKDKTLLRAVPNRLYCCVTGK